MRRIFQVTAPAAWWACALGLATAQVPGADGRKAAVPSAPVQAVSCGNYGTSVEFMPSPSAAARLARQEQKLVFVLHVSGHFEDPTFT